VTEDFLALKGLSKSYDHPAGPVPVLTDLSATVSKGERVAVIGPSGSGKSTLLSLLAGLDRPTAGQILLLSQDIGRMSERELTQFRARHLGIVFQQFHLMSHLTAAENVALPLRIAGDGEATEKAAASLDRVGLGQRLKHFPHELSGGECQRVAIARAMIGRPPLILADEPSGNLDARTGQQVMRMLFDLVQAEGATLILVTHNEELARWCDRRLTLSQGRLAHG
jgi:putative ABC transport system ATP-binding protein